MTEKNFVQPYPCGEVGTANDCAQEDCAKYLSDDELEALADLAVDYEEQRAEEQRIIVAELERMHREELRQNFEHYLLSASDLISPMIPVIKRHGTLICSEGNISAVVGEAKSKKTFLCTALVGSMLDVTEKHLFGIEHNCCKVLWIDTEQSREHIQRLLFRINVMGGLPYNTPNPYIKLLAVREESPANRLNVMRYAIEYYNPKLVVVDGISDLLNNTNNLEESEALVSTLLTLSSDFKCHIMSVLHTNPNSDKARGHLGSTLMRKAESVIYVHKAGEVSFVEPQYCRNMPFERFAFRVEEAEDAEFLDPVVVGLGIPTECDISEIDSVKKEDDCVRILRDELGGVADKRLLQGKLVDRLGVTHSYARVKIFRALEKSLIREDDGVVSIVG